MGQSIALAGILVIGLGACGPSGSSGDPDAGPTTPDAGSADANANQCEGAPNGTPCGDQTDSDCDHPDLCLNGQCEPNRAPSGSLCGDNTVTECSQADVCDDQGVCQPNDAPMGAPCGDQVATECSGADICDGAGACLPNDSAMGTPCGDPIVTECSGADACDGAGACSANHQAAGAPCGDQSDTDCSDPDICDGAGLCGPNDAGDGIACNDCAAGAGQCSVCMTGACLDACLPTPTSLTTTFAGGNGFHGNMFDVVALEAVTVTGFDFNINAGTHTIEVYFKSGSHQGSETNAAAWTLVGTATNVTSAGAGLPTSIPLSLSIDIPAGQTFSFYVTTTGTSNSYTDGTTLGAVFVQDANIQVLEGVGKEYPFLSTFTPRVFNGAVRYELSCP